MISEWTTGSQAESSFIDIHLEIDIKVHTK